MAFLGLDEMLHLIVYWEEELKDFYNLAEQTLRDPRSKKAVKALQKRHEKNLQFFNAINLKEYKHTEFIKNLPDYHSESVIPKHEISMNSTPQEIFEKIINYEEKLEEFYKHVRSVLVYAKSRELFDMLIEHKLNQIKEINGLMQSFDLVA